MVSDRTLSRVLPPASVLVLGDLIRVATAVVIVTTIAFVGIYYRFQGDRLNDFQVFYYSAQAWLNGQDMYGPTPATSVPVGNGTYHDLWNMNPPHFHLLVVPFAVLPLGQAIVGWVVMNVGLLACCLGAIARALKVRWTFPGAIWTIFVSVIFSATCGLVATGQVTWLIMVPVTYGWIAARDGRWRRAALLLGAAASIKPFLGVFLVYFILRRQLRLGLVMLGSGAACGLVGLLVFGWEAHWRWIETLRSVDWPWAPMNASLKGFLTRILTENPFVPHLLDAERLISPLTIAGSATLAFLTYRRLLLEREDKRGVDRIFAALLTFALLVSPLGWIYYMWLPVGPLLALFWFSAHPVSVKTRVLLLLAAPGLVWPAYALTWIRDLPLAAPTVAAVYFWTVLTLWLAATAGREHQHAG